MFLNFHWTKSFWSWNRSQKIFECWFRSHNWTLKFGFWLSKTLVDRVRIPVASHRRLYKNNITVFSASCSALMGGCEEMDHALCCHWLATNMQNIVRTKNCCKLGNISQLRFQLNLKPHGVILFSFFLFILLFFYSRQQKAVSLVYFNCRTVIDMDVIGHNRSRTAAGTSATLCVIGNKRFVKVKRKHAW